jgi:FecR protein
MHGCKWTPVLLLMGLLVMQSTAANAETRVGTAISTRPDAEGIVGTNSETLSPGSEVYANETVRTGNVGRANLVLLDNTSLNVGPASELTLDKFIYDQTGSKGSVVLQATRGAFRVVTGSQDHRAYQVNTPYGSLGDGESLANLMRDLPGEVSSPPSASLSYGEENNFGGTTNGSGGGTTVEVVVKPKGQKQVLCPNGRPRGPENQCTAECEAVVRLVNGRGASFTSLKGKRVDLHHPGEVACITPNGDIVRSTSSESILPLALNQLTTNPFASVNFNSFNPNGGTTTLTTSCQPSNTPSRLCP